MNILINENQLEFIQKNLVKKSDFELAEQNWKNLSTEEKNFCIEIYKKIYPKRAYLIKESKWYNTLMDFVGIVDPTGITDLINGLSYMSQGDYIFGLLSLISVIPIAGDAVAKPFMEALKIGSLGGKELNAVLKLSKAGKGVEAASELAKISSKGGKTTEALVNGIGKFGQVIKNFVEKLPTNKFLGGGLRKTILGWIELFENGAKAGKSVRGAGELLAKTLPTLSKAEQIKKLQDLMKISKESGLFSSFKSAIVEPKTIFGGMPKLIGRNKSTRALMKNTRWWIKFLEKTGFKKYHTPDEVAEKMGEEQFTSKLEEYQKTPEAQESYNQDFGEALGQYNNQQNKMSQGNNQNSNQQISNTSDDLFSNFFKSALG